MRVIHSKLTPVVVSAVAVLVGAYCLLVERNDYLTYTSWVLSGLAVVQIIYQVSSKEGK